MVENLEKGGTSRRNFLREVGALAAAAAMSQLPTNSAEAQETIESQESKIPSAQEIEAATREVLSPQTLKAIEARLKDFSIPWQKREEESNKLYDPLKRRYFGNQNMAAGRDAYQERIAPLERERDRYREQPDKKNILTAIEGRISEVKRLDKERDFAAGSFIRVTGEYMRAMETYLKLEILEIETRKAMEKLPSGGTAPATNFKGEKPDAEKLRAAAIERARAND